MTPCPSEALVRVVKLHTSETKVLFDTRSAKVTDVTRSSSSNGKEENLVQPKDGNSMEKPAAIITVTKHKSLVLISNYKENQIN